LRLLFRLPVGFASSDRFFGRNDGRPRLDLPNPGAEGAALSVVDTSAAVDGRLVVSSPPQRNTIDRSLGGRTIGTSLVSCR
jgi:hypothetical protein